MSRYNVRYAGGVSEVSEEIKAAVIEAGMKLGASREDATAVWIDRLIDFGIEHSKPWLKLHPDGTWEITRVAHASAELCQYLESWANCTYEEYKKFAARVRGLVKLQYYSAATKQTLTVVDSTPVEEEMRWIAAHPDAVLVYLRKKANPL